ncbi:MaoC family dehydratase [Frankia sp. AgKG'84/4]|uniref:MaoC family dehydratase n=1 Tax=Frankia sp. AgKG'84/4 TaxID=573490 RepID=UPI00200EE7FA|nr:MaoC family dehydratase [Frankia sp. AgKG'84/4]MCL9795729.1 MaoC family dehydratase [Frankia sp. AgKG'84/4]
MTKSINGVEELRAVAGQELGTSPWREVTQAQVNLFADATDDHQWIHVDTERAKEGPFKQTIAHGFLTLSLVPALLGEVVKFSGFRLALNYGLNKVRFPTPVPVGARVRGHVKNLSVEDVKGGVQSVTQITVEVEGSAKPACVAEFISRYAV